MNEVILNIREGGEKASWYYPFKNWAAKEAKHEFEVDKFVDWQLWLEYGAWRTKNTFVFPDQKSATAFLLRWA